MSLAPKLTPSGIKIPSRAQIERTLAKMLRDAGFKLPRGRRP